MKSKLILFLLLIITQLCTAQSRSSDSLIQLLKTLKEDTLKADMLNSLSERLGLQANFAGSLEYANKALALSGNLNFKKGIAQAYNNSGIVYWNRGDYADGLKNHFAALKIGEEIGDKHIIAISYGGIGNIYLKQGNFSEALKNYLVELKTRKSLNDKQYMAYTFRHLANVYLLQGNYPEAVKNYLASLKIDEELNNKLGICYTYCNIGILYEQQGNYAEALKNYSASLNIAKEINNKQTIASVYINIGDIYSKQGKYTEALKYELSSIKISDELQDKHSTAVAYNSIGEAYFKLNDYTGALKYELLAMNKSQELGDEFLTASSYLDLGKIYIKLQKRAVAREYLTKALVLSRKTGSKDLLIDNYFTLAGLDSTMGNLQEAYGYLHSYTIVKDSLLNTESNKEVSQLKIQYETEKKDKEIGLLNSENEIKTAEVEKQKIIEYVGFLFAALIILVAILIFNNTRIKNKAKQLTRANEIRQRISRDLHDEIGAGLTSISMTCEQGIIKLKNKNAEEPLMYDKISGLSRNVSEKLNEVVWATNPDNDNLPSLLSYLRSYVSKFFADSAIKCSVSIPDEIPNLPLKPDVSRNLFYVFKEALNNCAKHSQASGIDILFQLNHDKSYSLRISDNGKGIDFGTIPKHRSGFLNMRRRIEDIKGTFEIKSTVGEGTFVEMRGNFA